MRKYGGKWSIKHNKDDGEIVIESEQGYEVCKMSEDDVGWLKMAKLIAVAPALLSALQTCHKALSSYGYHPIIDAEVRKIFDQL